MTVQICPKYRCIYGFVNDFLIVGVDVLGDPFVRICSGRPGGRPLRCGGSDLSTGLVRILRVPITPKACISSIPQGIAYHQCEALYIIKPQEDARYRVMIYKGGIAALDDIPPCGG